MRILNLQSAQDCIIYGTFYKEMVLKPSILEEYTREVRIVCVACRAYCIVVGTRVVSGACNKLCE